MRFDRPTGEDAEHVAQSSSHGHAVRDRMVSREDNNRAAGFMNQGTPQGRRYVAGEGGEGPPRHLFLPTRAGHSIDDAQRNRGAVHMTEKRHATVVRLYAYREKWLAS